MIKIGDKLREERKRQGYSLDQVAKATKIRLNFLQAIEDGTYAKLPGVSYAHGFVKNYLEFLNLPIREYMALFRREYNEQEQRRLMPTGFVGKEEIPLKKFSLIRAVWLGVVVLLGLAIYLAFQYRASFLSPALTVASPKENEVISSQTVRVTGSTDVNTAVTVNNLPAYTDNNGNFAKEIPVFSGDALITIRAVNSFGKITTLVRHVKIVTSNE